MVSYTHSLSRWHKVAERLSRTYTELTQGVRNTFNNTQISGYLGDNQISRLREQCQSEAINMQRAFRVQDALIQIRQAIGEANAKTGVNHELAEYDALVRRHKFLESILSAQSTEMVNLDEISMLPSQVISEDRYDRSRAAIRIRVLDSESILTLRKEAEALLAKCYTLADRISDRNRERLTLELPEEIAKTAGL